jgi:two-component system, sporulation sensor kinase E
MKSGFLEKLLARLDQLTPEEMQASLGRLVREKGFFEQVFDALEEGVIVCDPVGAVTFWNRAATKFFGVEADAVVGRPLAECVRGFRWPSEAMRRAVWSQDLEVFYPENRYLNFYLRPIEHGEASTTELGYVMLVRDITQTRRLAEEQIESERLNALTMMAAGVAHEIGNPLNSLNIHLQLLERKIKKADAGLYERVREQISVARAEVQRLDFITEQFLRAIRPSRPVFELHDVNKVLEEAIDFLAPELKDRRITTRLRLHEGLPRVRVDAGQLKQAFYNLIKNAFQAMGTGGRLTIGSDLTDYDVVITFTDDGKGMDPETVAAIHEPWFTTRTGGSGLGMLIVRRIIREHGGELSIASEVGKGTSVSLTLPRGAKPVRYLESSGPDAKPDVSEVIDV